MAVISFAATVPAVLVVVAIARFVVVAISRLFLHPLRDVPGPKLAAITSAYEFYYECILTGRYHFKVNELHGEYGPIVRISPREVHISDPDFFDKLYNVVGKLNKDVWYYRFLDSPNAALSTETAELHRIRRKGMNRFFSPDAVRKLSHPIMKNLEKLCKRLDVFKESGQPVNLSNAFRCLVTDNTTDYVLPHGYNLLENEDFASNMKRQTRTFSALSLWHRFFPFIFPLFWKIPRWMLKSAPPGSLEAYNFQVGIIQQTTDVGQIGKRNDECVAAGIYNSDIPESEKEPMRVVHDTRTLVGAGSETTATTLEMIIWKVANSPEMLKKLKGELATAAESGGLSSFESLQKLPYLTAVVKEGLRRSVSVSGRLPRWDPKNAIVYKEHTLPPGTIISMDIPGVSLNPQVFPDPMKFDPERWNRSGEKERSEKYFVPFGKGQRICVGKEFATVSVYLTVANVFHKYDLDFYETTEKDLEMAHEMFAPFTAADSKGVRAYIR